MPEHKLCPACKSGGIPVVNEKYGFQVRCENPKCLLRGPSRSIIVEAWKAWDDPSWRTPSWGDQVHDLRANLDLANGELDWARQDLRKLEDKLELALLERDEWRDRYEELLASHTLKS
jgi:hypothetical protein